MDTTEPSDFPDLADTIHELLENYIPFSVHYPTKSGGGVITITDSLTHSQLQVAVNCGMHLQQNGKLLGLYRS